MGYLVHNSVLIMEDKEGYIVVYFWDVTTGAKEGLLVLRLAC